jgi:hypothetical protein
MKDEDIVAKVMSYLSKCIKDFEYATVMDKEIGRFPQSLTHFFPGNFRACYIYKKILNAQPSTTSIP